MTYIPALRFHWLTPFFDPLLRYLMHETKFKSVGRFFITIWSSYQTFAFGLNQAQFLSLVSLAISLPILVRMASQHKKVNLRS